MPHFVYIVRCANDALYTGYALNVDARVAKHNAGKGAKYTRMNGPVALLVSWEAPSHIAALKLERRIKLLPRAHKLALVAGRIPLPDVSGMKASAIWKVHRPRRRRKSSTWKARRPRRRKSS
jgi:putative endonuclease